MDSRRTAVALAAVTLVVLAGCRGASSGTDAAASSGRHGGAQTQGTDRVPSSSAAGMPVPAPQSLADRLLDPLDLYILGLPGMLIADGNSGGSRSGAGTRFDVAFLGGDPACQALLAPHPVSPASWAWVLLQTPTVATQDFVVVGDEIDAFRSRADAEKVLQQDRVAVATCHTFTGEFQGSPPMSFTFGPRAVARLGDDVVARALGGISADGGYRFTSELVDVRMGAEVLFAELIGPHATPEMTEAVTARAVEKSYSGG